MKRLLLLLAILALPGFAQINNYYVSTTGSDANNGTSSSPWRTISHASSALTLGTGGAIVHVAAGTYTESVITSRGGTSTQPITYVSDTKWGAKIVPASTSQTFAWETNSSGATYVTIKNFDVGGSNCGGIGLRASNETAIGNNVHNTSSGCDTSNGGAGIDTTLTSASGDAILNNFVHDIGMVNASCQARTSSTIQGIYVSNGGGTTVANNLVVNVCDVGIHLWHGASHVTVVNNTVVGNMQGILVGSGDSPCSTQVCLDDFTLVFNNIVAFNTQAGMYVSASSGGAIGTHNQFSNNLSFGNPKGDFFNLTCTPGCITGQNPLFVNNTGTAAGDYHLQATSPAIGAGTATDAPSTDFDGTARPQGGSYDIGAYEFASGGSVPSITSVTATPSGTIASGTAVTIAWASTGGLTATLNGAAVAVSGSQVFNPTVTTTYTLIVSNASGPSTPQAVTVTVSAVAKPTISSFTATPSTPITPGSPVTIAWTSTNGLTATLNGAPVVLGGSQVFSPLVTTDYVLIISNSAGPTSQTITVSVGALPVISSFTASPSTIALGGSSTLTLVSTGGTSCSINQGVGTVACNSSTIVSPVTSKLYTATVANSFGSKTAKAFVGVSISALLGATVVDGQVVIH